MSKTASFCLKSKVNTKGNISKQNRKILHLKVGTEKFRIRELKFQKNAKFSKKMINYYLVRYHYCLKFPSLPPGAQQLMSRLRPRELKHFLSMQKAILKILIQMWFEPLKEANRNQMSLIG